MTDRRIAAAAWVLLLVVLAAGLLMPRGVTGDTLGLRRFQTPELVGGNRVAQTFLMDANGLRAIDFVPDRTGDRLSGTVHLELVLLETDTPEVVVRSLDVGPAEIIRSDFYRWAFAPITDSLHRRYRFEISAPGASNGKGITVWATRGERLLYGDFLFNGAKRWATLAFQTDAAVSSPAAMLAQDRTGPVLPPARQRVVLFGLGIVILCLGFVFRAVTA